MDVIIVFLLSDTGIMTENWSLLNMKTLLIQKENCNNFYALISFHNILYQSEVKFMVKVIFRLCIIHVLCCVMLFCLFISFRLFLPFCLQGFESALDDLVWTAGKSELYFLGFIASNIPKWELARILLLRWMRWLGVSSLYQIFQKVTASKAPNV